MSKKWIGTPPSHCDICGGKISGTVFYDGKTKGGPWANMCHHCFQYHGIGLGVGYGQKYRKTKVEVERTYEEAFLDRVYEREPTVKTEIVWMKVEDKNGRR